MSAAVAETVDSLDDATADQAVRFVFGREYTAYEDTREVWGIPVRFRPVTGGWRALADEAAATFTGAIAHETEHRVQLLAYAIVSIDDAPLPPDHADRTAIIRDWLDMLIDDTFQAYAAFFASYSRLLTDQSQKN